MKTGKTLQELAVEIDRQNKAKKDYIANTGEMQMLVSECENGSGKFVPFLSLEGMKPFGINAIAHNQISEKTGIPARYYNRMLAEQPELLANNVNTWFKKEPAQRMIRTLDGKARAFLSDRYRRIDNYEIASAVLPMISDMKGATVESCEITDQRMYIKVVNPKVEAEIVPGDVVQSGLLISNSEIGLGSVSVMPLVYRLICSNGMIAADSGQRRSHIGRLNEADENYEIYRSETIEADDKAFILKLQDIVKSTTDSVHFNKIVSAMRTGAAAKITGDIPGVVELASKTYGILEKESQGVLDHLIRGNDLSLYGLANAVTHHAQEVGSYDRSTELEMTAWVILNMTHVEWNQLNKVAA
jgi:hypothetical protein